VEGEMDAIVVVSIAQAVVLAASASVVLLQTRSVKRTARASFQHEIFKGIMEQRTDSAIRTPEIYATAPVIQEMVYAAGDSHEMLARIRGMQDAMCNLYRLYQSKLIDEETWNSLSYQIASNWQSRPIAAVWRVVKTSGAYSPDFIQVVDDLQTSRSIDRQV
jgi:hypothetical protein